MNYWTTVEDVDKALTRLAAEQRRLMKLWTRSQPSGPGLPLLLDADRALIRVRQALMDAKEAMS